MINTLKIKSRIMELGLKQSDIARALDISLPTANQKINNVRPLNMQEARKISQLLKIEDDDFVHFFYGNSCAMRQAIESEVTHNATSSRSICNNQPG